MGHEEYRRQRVRGPHTDAEAAECVRQERIRQGACVHYSEIVFATVCVYPCISLYISPRSPRGRTGKDTIQGI